MKRFITLMWYFLGGYNIGCAIVFAKSGNAWAMAFAAAVPICLLLAQRNDKKETK